MRDVRNVREKSEESEKREVREVRKVRRARERVWQLRCCALVSHCRSVGTAAFDLMLSVDFEPRLTAVTTSPYKQTNSPLPLACVLSLGHVLQVNTLRSTKREQSKRTCSSTPMNTRTCMRTLMCTHTNAHRQSHALETRHLLRDNCCPCQGIAKLRALCFPSTWEPG